MNTYEVLTSLAVRLIFCLSVLFVLSLQPSVLALSIMALEVEEQKLLELMEMIDCLRIHSKVDCNYLEMLFLETLLQILSHTLTASSYLE